MGYLWQRTATEKRLESATQAVIEALENRQLLSVSLQFGLLSVEGTQRADNIVISPSVTPGKLLVSVNGAERSFAERAVRLIQVEARGGDDYVSVESRHGRRVTTPVVISGGAGDDTLGGGFGDDRIDGGSGHDLLTGGGGNDVLIGRAGDDRLLGGEGDDRILPGRGQNQVSTGTDPDTRKNDQVIDGGGTDTINAQALPSFPIYNYTPEPSGYSPQQIRRAYGFGNLKDKRFTNRGKGQAIAIVVGYHYPTARADLRTFSAEYGLPRVTKGNFWQVYASGKKPTTDEGWAGEAALDIQWARAIAPEATIILVEADTNLNADLARGFDTATRLLNRYFGGGVVSMSIYAVENETQIPLNGSFNNAYTRNITFVTASGDDPIAAWPGTYPTVVSVGGTALWLDDYGNRVGGLPQTGTGGGTGGGTGQVTYQDPDLQATVVGGERPWLLGGGGPSSMYGMPLWQQNRGVPGVTRGSPDLSYVADPQTGVSVYNSFGQGGQSGWSTVGGTSAGAPQISAMFALANQLRAQKKLPKLGNKAVEYLYKLGGRGPDAYFYDIEVGGTATQAAAPGWDFATGWGSPNAATLLPALTEESLPLLNRKLNIGGSFITYNPAAAAGTGSLLTTIQFKGSGTARGRGTIGITTNISRVFSTGVTVDLYGIGPDGIATPPDPTTGVQGTPIVLYRAGDTVIGNGRWQLVSQPASGAAVTLTGDMRFDGKIDKKGRISGKFFSIGPDGNAIRNVFTPNPLDPTQPLTTIRGTFKG